MKRYLPIALAAVIAVSCTDFGQDIRYGNNGTDENSAKIINSSRDASRGRLIVNVNEETAEAFENGDFTIIGNLKDLIGEASVRKVFPTVARTEEKARRYGLHRWYVIGFEEDVDLEAASVRLAELGEIDRVQYCTVMSKCSDGISHQYTPTMTKAATPMQTMTDDPYASDQWHYVNDGNPLIAPTAEEGADIGLTDAWRVSTGNSSVIVAVLDEGVQYNHPDLIENMWVNPNPGQDGYTDDNFGYNFVRGGKLTWKAMGSSGHGTHVAGTVAAVNNNGTGVCGVAGGNGYGNGVRIMSCQIFDGFNGGTPDVIAEAAKYAADHGASILQCSFGIPAGAMVSDNQYIRYNGVEYDAFRYFMDTSNCPAMDGGLIIFAAGNDSRPMAAYPGAFMDYICVTSFAADNLPAYYTNYGPGSNIAAPGGEFGTGRKPADPNVERSEVLSTMPTESFTLYIRHENGEIYMAGKTAADYGYMQGTSMACPHVSGVAALGLSHALALGKHFTHEEMVSMILTSTDDIDSWMTGSKPSPIDNSYMNLGGYRGKMGTGSINPWKLLMQIEGTPYIICCVGEECVIDLSEYFGENISEMTFTGIDMPAEDLASLGLTGIPEINAGRLHVTPERAGAGRIAIKAIAGGSATGGGDSMGGMEISKDISIISRMTSDTNGGWL